MLNANILNAEAVNYIRQWTMGATQLLIRFWWHYNDWFWIEKYDSLWNQIVQQISGLENVLVSSNQCKSKWNALKIGYENLKCILKGNPDGFSVHSPNNYNRWFHGELADKF